MSRRKLTKLKNGEPTNKNNKMVTSHPKRGINTSFDSTSAYANTPTKNAPPNPNCAQTKVLSLAFVVYV